MSGAEFDGDRHDAGRVAPPRPDADARRRRLSEAAVVRAVVWAARIVGLLTVVSAVLPAPRRLLGGELRSTLGLPAGVGLAALVVTTVAGAGLLFLATGLRRRKQRAWWVATGVTTVLVVVNVVHVLDQRRGLAPTVLVGALLVALLATRRHFVARQDPGGPGRAVRSFVQFGLSGFLVVWVLLAVNPRRLLDDPSVAAQAAHAGLSLIGVTGPVAFVPGAAWLDDLTAAAGLTFGVVAVVTAGYHLLRSPEPRPSLEPGDEQQLRSLLGRPGGDSLGYFALRRDKAAVFSHGGSSAVSYRVLAGVALASGDPVGDVGAWPGAIEEFLGQYTRYGWSPAVLGCSERGATAWAKAGLDALELGDEAVLDTATFTLDGRPMRGVRQTVARMQRSGHTVTVARLSEHTPDELAAIAERAHRWRGDDHERGFSMASSRVADPADPDAVVVTALRDGEPTGMLQLVPWGPDGLSLDLMVRAAGADNGINELMIAELLAAAPGLGVTRVSLNFAVFRSALERGERIGAGPVARTWARLLRIASRWWQIDSLYRFNAKFRPAWYPRYVLFPAVRDLPRILFVVLEAEGFGGRPPAVQRLLRR
ncbi:MULTISPECIES: phosphatidylglycerol lysyltransferase domain-containing protein [unclassified Pseudonocardia]|uniref:phosphatidylglycerol lysyltransferase domain-containing protein n=1 Tax=unclassified Pseudonocardia TaxID=2619320 RepID=UPI000A71345A|nr:MULTISPECIES: phosphatidylglycerol lysyltransferase domain-containing protein [unclassified Pseudonocardia]